jgi:Tfp pilus assembly protein PilX
VSAAPRHAGETGFTLLPVIIAMSLIAAIAFLLNRDNGVNARMIASQSELDRARYAAEAGLQAVNFVIQRRGCAGSYPTSSTPVTDSNFGGAAYSAYSTTSGGSQLSLVSTGTYNGASVTLTRAKVHVYQSPENITVQPDPTSGHDTYVNNGPQDRNFGGDARLRLQSGTYQPLLKFDLSNFPAGTRVVPRYHSASAKLRPGALLSLYQYDISSSFTGSPKLHAQLITRGWLAGTKVGGGTPDGATWKTYDGRNAWPSPGMGYAPAAVASTPYQHVLGWIDWDLTNAVAGWMSGVYPNYGIWLIEAEGSLGNTSYVSSNDNDTANADLRPKLTLNALLPCGTAKR